MKTRNYSYNPTLDYMLSIARLARAGKIEEAASLLDEVIASDDAEDDLDELDQLQSDAIEELNVDDDDEEESEIDDMADDSDDEDEEESKVAKASFRRKAKTQASMSRGQKVMANLKALR